MSTVLNALIQKNILKREALRAAQEGPSSPPRPAHASLIEAGLISENDLFETAKKVFPRPIIDLDQITVEPEILQLIPMETAMDLSVFPVCKKHDILELAMSDPSDIMARDQIRFKTDLVIKPLLCKQSQITEYIKKHYKALDTVHEILKETLDQTGLHAAPGRPAVSEEVVDLANFDNDQSAVVNLVNKILGDAVEARASDVHIEPQEKNVDVRYRIDGALKHVVNFPRDLYPRLAARIKILSRLDIAEQRKVQEGRIKIRMGERKIDLRISVIPIFHGEKIVLRILDNQNAYFDLSKLGLEPENLDLFKREIRRPQGVILVTGPTGSGKTTTLYGALQDIKCETKNIVTIEDPIEYLIEGINQLQLNHFKDVTFATSLKSVLRQDPDVLLVGEIRDQETAEIAFRASLTGHLVFSTLHTNNAASSITRLMDIGIEPYLISSSVTLIVAQRLVRLICPHCIEESRPSKELLMKFHGYLENANIKRFYAGKGCDHCNFSGFYGRTSIFEILKVDEKIRNLIFNRQSESVIMNEAVERGMRTLAEAGVMKVAAGLTTLAEVAHVTDVRPKQTKSKMSFSFAEQEWASLIKSLGQSDPLPAF